MESTEHSNELAVLTPPVIEVVVGGEVITVTPIKVRELMAFAQAVSPILKMLNEADQDWAGLNVSTLLMNHTEAVIRTVAIGIRRDIEFINDLGIDELVKLSNAVIEVNVDFFIQRVLPAIRQGFGRIASMAESSQAGGQSSISSFDEMASAE